MALSPAAERDSPRLVVSVVSHGHGVMVQDLLGQLAQYSAGSVHRVVLTLNVPEPGPQAPPEGWPFALDVRCNAQPLGFGSNHNRALADAREDFVCVLNPDVQLLPGHGPFIVLQAAAALPGVGCAYPVQLDEQGHVQDSERELPTPWALWRRRVLGLPQRRVDWVNAACLVLPLPVWQAVRGFDEAYFMYCEDVDLCLRVRLLGLELHKAQVAVLHAGQRASSRRWQHLVWHVRSLLRLWTSVPMWQWCRGAGARPGSPSKKR